MIYNEGMGKNNNKSKDASEASSASGENINKKEIAGGVAAGALESVADDAVRKVVPTRAAVNQKVHDEVQKIPVVGDVIDTVQKAGYLGHLAKLFGKKKK